MYRRTRFDIHVERDDLKSSPLLEQKFLDLLHTEPRSTDGLQNWMLVPFEPIFESLASTRDKSGLSHTLRDFYSRVTVYYTLKTVDGTLVPTPSPEVEKNEIPAYELSASMAYDHRIKGTDFIRRCTSFEPSEIRLWSEDPNDTFSSYNKVLVNGGTPCFFKKFAAGKKTAIREINAYLRLEEVKTRELMFVPRLIGVVKAEGSDYLLGFLTSYIGNGTDGYKSVDKYATRPEISHELKMRWAVQATFTLKLLHEAGIVWGDAKADNLLLDENNDAWLIDFGGSFTEGWVDKEKADTLEGDIQGMGKTLDLLGVTQWPKFLPAADAKPPRSFLDYIGDYTTPLAALSLCSAALGFIFLRRR